MCNDRARLCGPGTETSGGRPIGTQLSRVFGIIGRGITLVLLGLVTIIAIPLSLIFLPLRKLFSSGSDAISPDAVAEFERALEAMKSGESAALSALAGEIEGFPDGKDRFLGRSWLTNALGEGAPETVRWMLDQGVEVNYFDDEGYSPLQTAVLREDEASLDLVRALLESGADVNASGTLSETALHKAAALGDEAIVRLLLEHGADAAAWDSEHVARQPADYAEEAGHEGVARLLRARTSTSAEV